MLNWNVYSCSRLFIFLLSHCSLFSPRSFCKLKWGENSSHLWMVKMKYTLSKRHYIKLEAFQHTERSVVLCVEVQNVNYVTLFLSSETFMAMKEMSEIWMKKKWKEKNIRWELLKCDKYEHEYHWKIYDEEKRAFSLLLSDDDDLRLCSAWIEWQTEWSECMRTR